MEEILAIDANINYQLREVQNASWLKRYYQKMMTKYFRNKLRKSIAKYQVNTIVELRALLSECHNLNPPDGNYGPISKVKIKQGRYQDQCVATIEIVPDNLKFGRRMIDSIIISVSSINENHISVAATIRYSDLLGTDSAHFETHVLDSNEDRFHAFILYHLRICCTETAQKLLNEALDRSERIDI